MFSIFYHYCIMLNMSPDSDMTIPRITLHAKMHKYTFFHHLLNLIMRR